jgi:mannose-6-phosphate isomerase-like protein (cupin superfamily)
MASQSTFVMSPTIAVILVRTIFIRAESRIGRMNKVNLTEKLALLDKPWTPKIVGSLNDYDIQIGKAKGEFVWHDHPTTDEFFLVLQGRLTIQLRDTNVELGPGELYVVRKGVEHCPRSDEGAEFLMLEPTGIVNTGDAGGELTVVKERI